MNTDGTTAIKEPLERLLAHVPEADPFLLGTAYHWASFSHDGQNRDEGQPFVTHPIAVALILASELGFSEDVEMMVAALLHDAVEDSALSLGDITPIFGPAVTTLVRGVTKVEGPHMKSREAIRAATLQRLFASAQEDPRVLILKLADRMHNMRSIYGIKTPGRRERIARETLDVYAPLSYLLGMGRIRRELEDRSLECLEPEVYARLSEALDAGPPEAFQAFLKAVEAALCDHSIQSQVRPLAKSVASINRKVQQSSASISDIYDRYAVEVVASSQDDCYRVLGAVHNRFIPVMDRFKDFIALPKRNRYQALHTTVTEAELRFEIHIQTPSMNRMGELGVSTLKGGALQEERRRRWLQEIFEWQEHDASSEQLLEELKRILFVQEIPVFTPKRDPIILPEDATLLDFAFAVHTDLGLHCTGGTVNGEPVSPFTVLSWGDTVEVAASASRNPKPHWLQYAKTYRAHRLIRRYLKEEEPSDGLMFE